MRLESTIDTIHENGAEVIAISSNEDERQAGMAERWKLDHIKLVSDIGGEKFLKPLDCFDPDDPRGIALPAMIVIAPDGTEVYRYNGRDFADRTTDDEVMAALAGLDLDPVDPGHMDPERHGPEDLKTYFRTSDFGPYFRGNMFAAIAIGGRLPDKETAARGQRPPDHGQGQPRRLGSPQRLN